MVLYPDVTISSSIFRIAYQFLLLQYLPTSTLVAGVKAGQLHQGHFNANQYNYLEVRFFVLHPCNTQTDAFPKGSVPVPGYSKPILLIGRENMNRAVQGDVVVVEVFDEKEWKAPGDEVVDQECQHFFFQWIASVNPI
jgi:exosome complex exonuclease DIS3/RRP44